MNEHVIRLGEVKSAGLPKLSDGFRLADKVPV
jgi:hypothetical protein